MQSKKILVIGPSWVGDMIMAQSLFKVIKQHNSAAIIDVMAPAWTKALLERMLEVRKAIPMPLGHGQLQLKIRYQLAKKLALEAYDEAIVLPNSLKSALIPFFAKIPKRTGFRGEFRYVLLNNIYKLDKAYLTMTVQRFVYLAIAKKLALKKIPIPKLSTNNQQVKTTLSNFLLSTEKPILALCAGAEYGKSKQWPAKYFAEIAKIKIKAGWDIWIFGSEKDKGSANEINKILGRYKELGQKAINLCGKTSLSQAIDLLSVSHAVISNDSGLMHLAASLAVPVVGVYGSTDPNFTPPLGKNTRITTLNLTCSPCFKRDCPLGHNDCMEKLMPEEVALSLQRLLDQQEA